MAQKDVSTALVSALSPICVDKFQHSVDAASNLIELKKVNSWEQGSFIEKGGWATMPGGRASKCGRCAGLRHDAQQSSKVISPTPRGCRWWR
jgi:hypothetical protein